MVFEMENKKKIIVPLSRLFAHIFTFISHFDSKHVQIFHSSGCCRGPRTLTTEKYHKDNSLLEAIFQNPI